VDATPSFTTAGLHGSLEAAPLFDVVKMAERPGRVLAATYRHQDQAAYQESSTRPPISRKHLVETRGHEHLLEQLA
jgi:hypothetical protein